MAYRTHALLRFDSEFDNSFLIQRASRAQETEATVRTSHDFSQRDAAPLLTGGPAAATVADGGFDWIAYAAHMKHNHGEGFLLDGIGDNKDVPPVAPLLITADQQPGDTSTTASLTIDGAHVVATIDTVGDEDWFTIHFEAGQTYDISMFLVVGGPSLVPLADAFLELYDASGTFIMSADGGGQNTPSGLDAILTYTAEVTGTYYVAARAFDNVPADGDRGDFVGDYEIFATSVDANDPNAYKPFYSPDSPLSSIDWGSVFDRSSRNPDGDNGSRPNDRAPDGTSPITNNEFGIVGKNVITYYFAQQGDIFLDEEIGGLATMVQAQNMQDWEKAAFRTALDQYEHVADIIYIEVDNRAAADLKFITYLGTPGPGASLLGRMSPPNEPNEGQAEFNAGDARWTEEGVSQGGFYFSTLLHEFGHGHGMAHPHDNGGRSTVMDGAGPSDDPVDGAIGGELGAYDLSQQVFTVMSYNDGWQSSPYGMPSSGDILAQNADPYGWMGTLGALDIAVIQDKYGVNEEYNAGANVYLLKDVNAQGTFYSTIWDGGGKDEIRYTGERDAVIDLRPATLQYEEGGGGYMNYAYGIHGGYTIANGVVIENGTTGSGNDSLRGNDVANTLRGNAGNDIIWGMGGNDRLEGGDGDDALNGGTGNDYLLGGDGADLMEDDAGGTNEQLYGQAGDDTLTIRRGAADEAGSYILDGGAGDDRFVLAALAGTTVAKGGQGNDRFEVSAAAQITTGIGVDLIRLEADLSLDKVVTVEDFTAGAGGDALDLTPFMSAQLIGWDGASSPIDSGHVRLIAHTSGTMIQVDLDGGGDNWINLIRLKGVAPEALTAENLGFALSTGGGVVSSDIVGGSGDDAIKGTPDADVIRGMDGNDMLQGFAGDDQMYGGAGKDKLYGLDGDDRLYGGDAFDHLIGGNGNDQLFGEAGDDVMSGGLGRDELTGGAGKDTFTYNWAEESVAGTADRILDFNFSEGDRLNVRSVDADINTDGDQNFVMVSAFDGHAAQAMRIYDAEANLTTLYFDVDGDAAADMVIELNGEVTKGWIL